MKSVARVLRRIADRIDPPSVKTTYEPPADPIRVSMPEPTLEWITTRHERPDSGYEVGPSDEPIMLFVSRGFYL